MIRSSHYENTTIMPTTSVLIVPTILPRIIPYIFCACTCYVIQFMCLILRCVRQSYNIGLTRYASMEQLSFCCCFYDDVDDILFKDINILIGLVRCETIIFFIMMMLMTSYSNTYNYLMF